MSRLETLLIDYFGVADNSYTRQVMKVSLTAAVARAVGKGVKWDYTPIIYGPQGKYKTWFFEILGSKWFNNSLGNFDGKEAAITIQGSWIVELGELASMAKSELNAIKLFLTKREDIYREPFGRRTGKHPRRCVFFGTTNDWEFLRDRTGDRRFWPVVILETEPTKVVPVDLPKELDQIWAEAYFNYSVMGLKLDLEGDEAKAIALEMQQQHSESSPLEGMITEFLEKEIPEDWQRKTVKQRRDYFNSGMEPVKDNTKKYIKRDRICALEIWNECFGRDPGSLKRFNTKEINDILANNPAWERGKKAIRFGEYGVQKGFKKKDDIKK